MEKNHFSCFRLHPLILLVLLFAPFSWGQTNSELRGILNESAVNGTAVVGFLSKDEEINLLYDRQSIRQHTLDVFDGLFAILGGTELVRAPKNSGLNYLGLLKFAVALHDIGKGIAIEEGNRGLQHEKTNPILLGQLKKYNFSPRESRLVYMLVNNVMSDFLDGNFSAEQALVEIRGRASELGIPVSDYLVLDQVFFSADAGAYPWIRAEAFSERPHWLRPKNQKYNQLLKLLDENNIIAPEAYALKTRVFTLSVEATIQHFTLREKSSLVGILKFLDYLFSQNLQLSSRDEVFLGNWIRDEKLLRQLDQSSLELERIVEVGLGLFPRSLNVEYTWSLLQKLGLREALMKLGGSEKFEELAYWMDKEPLRSKPVGARGGRTFAELRASGNVSTDILVHLTSSRSLMNSVQITKTANFFISREGKAREVAKFGDGLYFSFGRGSFVASSGCYRITMRMKPFAREGWDFEDGRLLNKNAVEILVKEYSPEDLINAAASKWTDGAWVGLLDKYKSTPISEIPAEDQAKMLKFIEIQTEVIGNGGISYEMLPFYEGQLVIDHPELLEQLLSLGGRVHGDFIVNKVLSRPEIYNKYPDLVLTVLRSKEVMHISMLSQLRKNFQMVLAHPEWIDSLLADNSAKSDGIVSELIDVSGFLSLPHAGKYIRTVVERGHCDLRMAAYAFKTAGMEQYPELMEMLIRRHQMDQIGQNLSWGALSLPMWKEHPYFTAKVKSLGGVVSLDNIVFVLNAETESQKRCGKLFE